MRLTKHLMIGLAVAATAASGATAHDKPAKPDNSARCKPAPVMLAGTLANDPAAGDTSFQLMVKHANRLGRLYAKAANPVSLNVDDKTRMRKGGQKVALDALALNDRAVVLAKVCRADVRSAINASSALPALTARLVLAKAPPADSSSESNG
jgi:hypothetical protein